MVDYLWGQRRHRVLVRGRQEARRRGEEMVEGSGGGPGAVRGFEGEGTTGHGDCGRQGPDSPLESPEGAQDRPPLHLCLLPCRAVRVNFSGFKHYICADLLQQLRETHTQSEVRPQRRCVPDGAQEPGGGGMECRGGVGDRGRTRQDPPCTDVIRPRRFFSLYSGSL